MASAAAASMSSLLEGDLELPSTSSSSEVEAGSSSGVEKKTLS